MLIIFGLGNVGKEYENTYHNMGFMCLNNFLQKNNLKLNKSKYFGNFCETIINGEKVVFVEPTTFMNNSGTCVKTFMKKFDATENDILVVFDDYDLPIGEVRFRKNGSTGTHNGMRDIKNQIKTDNFKRLRIGIKNPNINIPLINYVLSKCKTSDFENVFEKTNAFLEEFISKSGNVENVSLWLIF